jgi:UDP-GlcNAc:undecaprenyl-phosphate GlcNAc-1-phosphate transferase
MSLLLSTSSLAVCSFALALLFTPLLRDLALRRGWVDEPDNHRKLHKVPIPRIGGIAIVLAYIGSFSFLLSFHFEGNAAIHDSLPLVFKLLPAVVVVFATGLLDDCIGLKPWQKLLGVTIAAGLACLGDIQIHGLAYHPLPPFLGVPLTIIWLVGCANAFNLIDGVDGVATGLGLLATLTTLGAALWHGDTGLVMATVPLAGALLGFLRFNFNPASVFLGDCGSLSIGFLLGCCAVIWSHKAVTLLGMTAPLMALSVPLLDMLLSIVRRVLLLRPIFSADRGHIHHRLLDRGLTPRRVTLLLYATSSLAAGFALLQCAVTDAGLPVTILFCAVVWMGIQFLRYYEFGIVSRFWRENNVRSMVKFHCSMHGYEESVRGAVTVEQCWRAIRTLASEFGFSQVALRFAGRSYQEELDEITQQCWFLQVPLSDSEYVRFTCKAELANAPLVIAPLAGLLLKTLSAKSAELNCRPKPSPRISVEARGTRTLACSVETLLDT